MMKSMPAGLALCFLGGVAFAQTPPVPATPPEPPAATAVSPKPPAPAASPATTPATGPDTNAEASPPPPSGPKTGAAPDGKMPPMKGEPEGEIIETPNGFYLVRPGTPPAHGDESGPAAGAEAPPPGEAAPGPGSSGPGDENNPDAGQAGPMAGEGDAGEAPVPNGPGRRHPPMRGGQGARMRIHTPSVNVDVKCPDDEPIKACVDAISELLDKTAPQPQH